MSCRATREWLHRDAASLDEAQRLHLDDHLASCADCRGDRERLRLVREVGTSLPIPPAGARDYSRAIARALVAARPEARAVTIEGAPRRESAPRRLWLLPIFAAAVAAAVLVMLTRDHGRLERRVVHVERPGPVVPTPPAPVEDVVADGVLIGPAKVELPSLRVALAEHTQVRWTSNDRLIVIEQGKVEIDASGEPARVITQRFEVELTDTDASIDKSGVRVRRGTARVVDRSRKLLAQLEAGSDWQPAEPAGKPRTKPVELAQARTQLADGQHAEAERTAEAVLARPLSRAEEAEARMFLADLAQATGNLGVAVSRYDTVATKFADLPAAESALYAAARIEARRGRADAARTLFDRYLQAYPNGRYADDVRNKRRP